MLYILVMLLIPAIIVDIFRKKFVLVKWILITIIIFFILLFILSFFTIIN